jgi:hypothetical protein
MSQSFQPVGPAWLQYLWTVLFSMAVAAGFTVLGFVLFASGNGAWRNVSGWGEWYLRYLVVSLCIGFSIHLLFNIGKKVLGGARIPQWRRWQRTLYFSGIPISGTLIGLFVGSLLLGSQGFRWVSIDDPNAAAGSILLSLLIWFVFSLFFWTRHAKLLAERRAAQAQLRLLQGQMEPHFLFNTLANVLSLMDTDAPRAKAMLESFTDYLRASLGSLRGEAHTLGAELDLITAYLLVATVRMEDRLRYRIDVPDALRAQPLPALSLQPLVENAVQHGLEPQIAGGTVAIDARLEAGTLVVRVTDDGLGLRAVSAASHRGTGTAVANIRERLLQGFGDRASLSIESVAPHGVCATLRLPAG